MIIAPLLFIRPKLFAWLTVILSPLLLFEFYNVYNFKAPSSEEAIASIFYTNAYEGKELFKSNIQYAIIFFIVFGLLILSAIKIKWDFKLPRKNKFFILGGSFIIFSTLLIRDYRIVVSLENNSSFTRKIDGAISLFKTKVNKTFPLGDFYKIKSVKKGIKSIKNYQNTIKNFKFNASKKDTIDSDEIYVLVIGETARKENFSLLGYHVETNPLLKNQNNINSFNHVKSAANLTSISLPFLITRATPNNLHPKYNEPAVINAFKESGFKTYWLTNQAAGLDNVFAFYSRLADYYKNIAISIDVAKYDEELLPELDKILKDTSSNKKFIIIHTLGSHFRYNFRYPNNFEFFKPTLDKSLSLSGNSVKLKTEIINSYNNSILYTDYILSKIIKKLENLNTLSFMYYVSDHGENLYDDDKELLMHGFLNPSEHVIKIPIITWTSNAYAKQYPTKVNELKKHQQSKITSNDTFYTLLDMANITYKDEKLNRSFVNQLYNDSKIRYLLTPNQKVIKLD